MRWAPRLPAIFPAAGLPQCAPGKLASEDIITETASAETEATPAAEGRIQPSRGFEARRPVKPLPVQLFFARRR
jgi:hypothetical protein